MQQTQLVKTLRLIPNTKYQKLRQFVEGMSSDKMILTLLDLLLKHRPDFTAPKLDKDKIGKTLFKAEWPEKTAQLNYLNNELKNLVEQFLVWMKLVDHKNRLNALGQYLLIDQVATDYSLFSKKAEQFNQQLREHPNPGTENWLQSMTVNRDLFFHIETDKFQQEVPSLDQYQESLEIGYWIEKLRIISEWYTRQSVVSGNGNHSPEAIPEKVHHYRNIPTIRLYLMLIQLQVSFSDMLYHALKKEFFEHSELLEDLDQRNILTKLINLANQPYEKGKLHWIEEFYDLYRFEVEKNLVLYQGRISGTKYINIISIAASLPDHIGWAIDFANQYRTYLPPDLEQDCYLLGQAHICYFQNDLEKAFKYHYDSNFRGNTSLGYRHKTLEIWLKYEEEGIVPKHFLSALDSFRKFLKNHEEMHSNRSISFQNLIGLSKKLYALKIKEDRKYKDLKKLETTILDTQPLFSRAWLLIQVRKLKASIEQPDYKSPAVESYSN